MLYDNLKPDDLMDWFNENLLLAMLSTTEIQIMILLM